MKKLNKLAVSILFAVNGFLFANYLSRLPAIQFLHALDNGEVGLILLASAAGALLAMPFTGWLIVRRGSHRIAAISGLVFCLATGLIGIMPNGWFLAFLFFIVGLSTGSLDVSMNAQAVVLERSSPKPVMSFFHALYSAGMMAGAANGALFTKLATPLPLHLGISSVLGLLFVSWAIMQLIPDPVDNSPKGKKAFQIPHSSLVGIGLIAFCCMLGEGAMANWSTHYMLRVAASEEAFAPMGLLAFSMAMMVARFGGDYLRAVLGDRQLMIGCSALAVFGLGFALLIPSPLVVLFGCLFIGLGLSLIVPIAYSTAGNAPGLSPGVGISMVTTIGYSGLLAGPPIIGFLAEWLDLRFALLFTLFLFLIMTGLSVRWKARSGESPVL